MIYAVTCNICFFIAILILTPSCTHKRDIDKATLCITKSQCPNYVLSTPPPLTVWIHGTVLFRKPPYYDTFHKKSSLKHVTSFPDDHRFRRIANTITTHDPEHFSTDEFYIFCWSGKLSSRERKKVAEQLYRDLIEHIEQYQKKYGQYPIIRIIAHSHGGNVALHMAKIHTPEGTPPITVHSLILLACPVQEKTMHLIATPLFKHVYSLYSSFDFIQVLAPQLRHKETKKSRKRYRFPAFSSRLFPQHPSLTQAKIKINGYPITHTYFSQQAFVELLPDILQKLDSWDADTLAKEPERHRPYKYKLLCVRTV
jgi:hypothetical protein